ncbi:MAG: phosphoribosyltransferase family protein [Candidatus Njordarchaeales archaeon]
MRQMMALKTKLRAIDILRVLKRRYTYEELSQYFGLPVPVLSRYIQGHVLPREDRAREIIEAAKKLLNLEAEIRDRLFFDEYGFFDNTRILFDITLLRLIAKIVAEKYSEERIDKILTAAVDGLPFAMLLGSELDVDVIYTKREKEVGVKDYVEEYYVPGGSGIRLSLYLPKNALKPREYVLIVDDIIRTGETQRALINIVHRRRAIPIGVYILIAIGDKWRSKIPENVSVEYFVKIPEPTTS